MPKAIITRSPEKPLFHRSANEFAVKSVVSGPLGELSLLRRGLCFAELSMFDYMAEDQMEALVKKLNFEIDSLYTSQHGRAALLRSKQDLVLVFRGVGERDWQELQGKQRTASTFAETVGKVQRCFKKDADELWPPIEKMLESNRLPLWFCGHSLGAAFANICAQRCLLSYIRSEPQELHTFGSPRIGNRKYVHGVELKHYRWVNHNDLVTQLPPVWLGYRHSGTEMYLDRQGELKKISGWRRVSDQLQGALGALLHGRFDHASDHSVVHYVDQIFGLVRAEKPSVKAVDNHPQTGSMPQGNSPNNHSHSISSQEHTAPIHLQRSSQESVTL
jgi:triacylglycerol lipase